MVSAANRARNPARSSVWLEDRAARPGSSRKAEQPEGLDRDRIVATAVRLLDAEGLGKLSMRRIATELNVTAMSLYWYVDTKDDILELAVDAVFGELPLTDPEDGQDWRIHLRRLAADYREVLVRHPWVSTIVNAYLNIGPHSVAFAETVQKIIRATGLPPRARSGATAAVFQFAYGFATIEGHFIQRCAASGMTPDEFYGDAIDAFQDEPQLAGQIDEVKDVIAAHSGRTVAEIWADDFEFALDVMVAGVEEMVRRAEG
ncbi:TetR/AcrR family transcriptional regulator [Streptomyces luteolus]|uniref:TetR/AcrR family transcriptional regulator C-terminal domain-containing protein n=1 Tax=Streptomyces luteolus TaxID=3043615 RepID=A0ABT6T703_9ACTN|nr:TetR/AcrR family transcriptional regulator C-terminal domain-containing protein [Streptomyces sp. B-S-A12]MDI3423645.1 TetR/AcrR family transcriptional regulator C-terminal domain-containing protein [Streptomyces sp. B-S-A12]